MSKKHHEAKLAVMGNGLMTIVVSVFAFMVGGLLYGMNGGEGTGAKIGNVLALGGAVGLVVGVLLLLYGMMKTAGREAAEGAIGGKGPKAKKRRRKKGGSGHH
jgi:hypothetical protein